MNIRNRVALLGAVAMASSIGFAAPASAQATRTWVSGVGDDVNPCSRTAPCKTFAGAISKTAAGGEINCLDPGGYGAVTITKSMTIDCHYTEGGALAGGNGITVNDGLTATPNTSVVYLRGLDIFGVNPPTNGVRFVAGASLHLEDVTIRRFNAANSAGVSFAPSGTANLFISNSMIANNGNGATGGGVVIAPTGAGIARVSITNSRVKDNANVGISINTSGTSAGVGVSVADTEIAGNTGNGISVLAPSAGAQVMLNGLIIVNNSQSGIRADGAGASLRVGNSTIMGNAFTSGAGVTILNSANVRTYLDNRLDGNQVDGAFTAPSIPKK
jgi:hypothetical protein